MGLWKLNKLDTIHNLFLLLKPFRVAILQQQGGWGLDYMTSHLFSFPILSCFIVTPLTLVWVWCNWFDKFHFLCTHILQLQELI